MHQWDSYLARIRSASDASSLAALELELFGRKQGVLAEALKGLGALSPDERMKEGQALNQWKTDLTTAIAIKREELTHATLQGIAEKDRIDVTLDLPEDERTGHLHLIPQFIRTVEEVFGRMGFDVARGNEVEHEDFNFFKLNFEKDHAALDMQATFWMKDMQNHVLRTHTSPVQVHYMQSHKPPFRMICPGRVYRRDADATHSPMFHQFEGLMIGEDISIANMKAIMASAIRELVDPNIEFRFRASYFPFVEPGLEVDMRWKKHGQESDDSKWLEVVGCGMVHPNVLQNCGIDPKKWRGFAFGFGIERLLMIKHGIRDLRLFYENDVRFLRQF